MAREPAAQLRAVPLELPDARCKMMENVAFSRLADAACGTVQGKDSQAAISQSEYLI